MTIHLCSMCYGSGQIAATHKKAKTVWAFACTCGAAQGRNLSSSYVTWNSSFREKFDVDFEPVTYTPKAPTQPKKPIVDYKVRTANPRDVDDDVPF